MAYCILVRHGRSRANADGVLAGWSEGVGLDETGRAQAQALVGRFGETPVAHVALSPLQRCAETAQPLLDHLGLTAEIADGLGECHYGGWTARPLSELAKEPLWRIVQDEPRRARFPDSPDFAAESITEMAERAVATVREIDARVTAEHGAHAVWVAVSHGDPIKAVLADAVGTDLDHFQRLHVDPASISVVHYTSRPMLLRSNDVGDSQVRPAPPAGEPSARPGDALVGGGAG